MLFQKLSLALLSAIALGGVPTSPGVPQGEKVKPVGIDHAGLWTSNIDKSVAFYHEFLGFTEMQRGNEVPNGPNVYYGRDGSPENLAKEKQGTLFMVKFWVGNHQALELFPARSPIGEGKAFYHFGVGFEDPEPVRRALLAINAKAPNQPGTGSFFTYDKNITCTEVLQLKPRKPGEANETTAISNHLLFVEIPGDYLPDLKRFYGDTLNFRPNPRGSASSSVRFNIGPDGEHVVLRSAKSPEPCIGFEVKNLESARTYLEKSPWRPNYKAPIQIEMFEGRRCIVLLDPVGVRIMLVEDPIPLNKTSRSELTTDHTPGY